MRSLKGVIWGTVLGLSLAAVQVWAQGQMPQDQTPQGQTQPDQTQQPPDQQPAQPPAQPDTQVAQPPAPEPPPAAQPSDAQPPQAELPQAQPPQAPPQQAPPQQAQMPPAQPGDQSGPDAPSRVARLQYTSGSVSIQPQGTGDWVEASINRPLTNADNVWADKDSRAELNVGDGVLRLGSESSLTLSNIGDNTVQVELHQGTLNLRVRQLGAGEVFEVDTPNMAFTVQKTGEYRFDVDPNGDSSIAIVWKGEGEATGEGPAVQVKANERARFRNGTSLQHDISSAPPNDGFDDWCQTRDEREDHSVSAQYVAPGTIGTEDLDEYGSWRNEEPYGEVWVPSGVAAGWAPYSLGHWVWIAPWGWTWVDDEPWGFAPFHYGRWVYGGGYWGWAPGPFYARPFYAPALVAWFGGPGFGVGFGFGFGGGIGWCPLGWGEPFFPWYRGSWGYFSRVNFYNARIGNINQFRGFYHGGVFAGASFHYANLRAPGGAIAVPQRALTNSLSVRSAAVRVPASQFDRASLGGGRVPVNPTMNSRLGANAGRATAVPPSRSFSRPVASRLAAPAGARGMASANAGRFGMNATASGHYVPRPPQGNLTARNNAAGASGGRSYSSAGTSHYVPRPPAGSQMSQPRNAPENRSEPRGTSGGYSRPTEHSTPHSSPESGHGRSFSYAPQSTAPGRTNPSTYANNGYRNYSSPSYSSESRSYMGGGMRSYGGSQSYSAPSYRSYSAPLNRSYSAPSYRGYSGPSRSYSAPSNRGSGSSFRGSSGGGGSHSSGGSHSGGGGHGGRR